MRVLVTGSYRPDETHRPLSPGRGEEFRAVARLVGRLLAEEGHCLLLPWSNANVPSQLGVYPDEGAPARPRPDAHPYWETADYHALAGFAEAVSRLPPPVARGRIVVEVVGRVDPAWGGLPFPDPATILRRGDPPDPIAGPGPDEDSGAEASAGARADAPRLPDRGPGPFPNIARLRDAGVLLLHHRAAGSVEVRSDVLARLMADADLVLVLGGGRATEMAALKGGARVRLAAVARFCRGGAFTDVEAGLPLAPRLARRVGDVAGRHDGNLRATVMELVPSLAALRAAAAAGPGIPWDRREFRAALLVVLLLLAGTLWRAHLKMHGWRPGEEALMLAGLVALFATVFAAELHVFFRDPVDRLVVLGRTLLTGMAALGTVVSVVFFGL